MLINLEIKKCIYIMLAVLVAMVCLVALGSDIPVLRQFVGFIFLTFVPGILILRILRVHNISVAESLVYSVGLSLAFIMFLGLFMNMLYPVIGVSRPITIYPLIITMAVAVLILCAVAYAREKDFLAPSQPEAHQVFSPVNLFLVLLPLLAILGALLVNYYQNNTLLLIFILITAATVALVAFGKFIPERAYPLVIVMIAIALLYQTSATLASPFLTGYDIQAEHLYQGLTMDAGYWSPERPTNLNTALSLMLLSPIYSLMLGMDGLWIFKIIYPLFFCLVPLTLFLAYREQAGSKRAFFATFFFMSALFFIVIGTGARMVVSQLFFALLILLLVDRKLTPLPKSALAVIFVMALPLSHYGLAYICLFLFVVGWLLFILMKKRTIVSCCEKLMARLGSEPPEPGLVNSTQQQPSVTSILTRNLIIIFIVFTLGYYMYIASGAAITSIINIGQHIVSNVGEFFNPVARESLVGAAIGADFLSVSPSGRSFRVFQYIIQIFIIIGFIRLLLKPEGLKFRAEYVSLTVVSALILFMCIVLPYFSGHLEVERFYHFALFFLSPFCIMGGETIWQGLSRLFRTGSERLKFKRWILPFNFNSPGTGYLGLLVLGVLIPYFLFNTGFIFEVTRSEAYNVVDTPSSVALSGYRIDMKISNSREHAVVEWLPDVVDTQLPVYGDRYGYLTLLFSLYSQSRALPADATQIGNAYIFLRTWNVEKNEVVVLKSRGEHIRFEHISLDDLPELSRQISSRNLIYNNGGAQVWAP